MKESLDSVKNTYHLFVVASTITLFFGLAQKFIDNPYEYALMEISIAESELMEMQQKGEIAFRYDSVFFIFTKNLLLDVKKSIKELDSLEKMNIEESIITSNKDTLFISLEHYRKFAGEMKQILSNKYDHDSINVEDLVLYSRQILKKDLFQDINNEYPNFRIFYQQYRSNKISYFKETLRVKADDFEKSSDRKINISGIDVSIQGIGIAIPLLPAGLLIYLYILIQHTQNRIVLKEDIETIKGYPLILFFNSPVATLVVMITLFIPSFSSSFIAAKGQNSSSLKTVLIFAYPILLFFLFIITFSKCEKIKKHVHQIDNQ